MKYLPDSKRIEVLDDIMVDVLRCKTVTERVEMVFAANRTVRLVIEGSLRTRHPNWSDKQLAAEIARRMADGTS